MMQKSTVILPKTNLLPSRKFRNQCKISFITSIPDKFLFYLLNPHSTFQSRPNKMECYRAGFVYNNHRYFNYYYLLLIRQSVHSILSECHLNIPSSIFQWTENLLMDISKTRETKFEVAHFINQHKLGFHNFKLFSEQSEGFFPPSLTFCTHT